MRGGSEGAAGMIGCEEVAGMKGLQALSCPRGTWQDWGTRTDLMVLLT